MPKFILALDSSQVSEYLTCPLKWYYRYNQNLVLNEARKVAPDKGTLVHNLLDIYYTMRALDPTGNKLLQADAAIESFKKIGAVKNLFPHDDEELELFICKRFMLYVQRWLLDDFNVIKDGVEVGFSYKLYEDENNLFMLEGRIDLLNKIQGIGCFTDHKSQERTVDLYEFSPQFKTYALVTGFDYGIINYFGMQEDTNNDLLKKNKLFRKILISFGDKKWLIEEWKQKLIEIFFNIKAIISFDSGDHEKLFYRRRNDKACEGPFGCNPCQFTHICETHWNMKEQVKAMKYTIGEPWRPW